MLASATLAACPSPTPPPPAEATLEGAGFSVHLVANPFSLEVVGADGATKLATTQGPRFTLDARTTEAQLVPGWDGTRHHEKPWTTFTEGRLTAVSESSATVTFHGDGATVRATVSVAKARARVVLTTTVDDARRFNTAGLSFALPEGSHFFGMGQRTASVDHLGLSLYSWPEEGGLGGGEDAGPGPQNPYPNGPSMTYFPVPLFHTTRGVSVLVDTTRRSEVRFGSDASLPGTLGVVVEGQSVPLVLYVRAPLEALDDYTADTGRPPLPAPWAYGPRRRVNRGAKVDGVDEWQAMRDRKLPLTTIDDAMHSLPSYSQKGDEATYRAWTSLLHAHGFKVMNYNNPYVSASAPNSASDYAFGAARGFFEQAPDGGPATTFFLSGGAQTVSAIDLTNPDAAAWFESLLGRSFDLGYDGWMHDFGEYVARSSRFHDGRTGDEVHNEYPVLSAKAGFRAVQAGRGGDAHVFTRSGYTGSQRWVLETWGGDPEASFDDTEGLPALLRGGLNLGLVGVPYWSSDMGGYKCLTSAPHDQEMLVRWYEMSALSPMMHDEDACSNPLTGQQTKARLWDDAFTQDAWRTHAGLHTRLAPYFRALAVEAQRTGAPITRHPFLVWPSRPEAWTVEDSFYVGRALYGAPVVRRGLTARKVWLPPGRFVEWTSRALFQGPATVEVPAPLERLPLFLVEGELLPLLDPEVQTLAPSEDPSVVTEASRSGVLDVVVALRSGSGLVSLTLADGTTLTAARGAEFPNDVKVPEVMDEAAYASCEACAIRDTSGGLPRVRLATSAPTATFDGVTVGASDGPPRRVRWEVLLLP